MENEFLNKDLIVETSLKYKDVKYRHQGRDPKYGLDCAGLIVQVAKDLNIFPSEEIGDYKGYSMRPDGFTLVNHLKKNLLERNNHNYIKGDVLLMRFEENPQHLAIYVGEYLGSGNGEYIIHSYLAAKKVNLHRLDSDWKKKIVSVFCFKNL